MNKKQLKKYILPVLLAVTVFCGGITAAATQETTDTYAPPASSGDLLPEIVTPQPEPGESLPDVVEPLPEESGGNLIYGSAFSNVRVGLAYGSDALVAANLQNAVGSGYTFGYFDAVRAFHPVGETDETKITMLKDWTIYLSGGKYYDEAPAGNYEVIGCYHIRLNTAYTDFASARDTAAAYSGAFPAYHNGLWYVCVGSYTSLSAAETALYERGLDGTAMTASSQCVTVVATGTTRVLFQFDYGSSASLAVKPRADAGGARPQTWFRGYKYYGAFQYTRLGGANITVVNVVDMEDYVKGVIPYEMNTLWPLEALKAQAVCARNYAAARLNYHRNDGFDLCPTVCCQSYYGTNKSGAGSDRAVDETAGVYMTHEGKLCQTFYFSSDGGATENCENVFNEAIPYLRGVIDPYEQYVDTGYANWSFTYSAAEITSILQSKGYRCAQIVSITPTYTELGNVYSLKFTDADGKNWTFSRYNASTILYSSTYGKYTYSMNFTVKGVGQTTGDATTICVNDGTPVESLENLYAVGSGGVVEQVQLETYSILSADGVQTVSVTGSGGSTITADSYVISGSGWGHNVGLSQFGAKAMAEQGFDYQDILNFYFTGVTIE